MSQGAGEGQKREKKWQVLFKWPLRHGGCPNNQQEAERDSPKQKELPIKSLGKCPPHPLVPFENVWCVTSRHKMGWK